MGQHFPKTDERTVGNVKVELNLSNYPTKADLKGAIDVGTSKLAVKPDLTRLKAQVNTVDVNRLKIVPVGLR